ncbi:hypothetical protein O6H91_12G013400 [Diphasiastrum complanatum]|uniref:Uncharacterized protein n=1 Tax=Diphasiastrum complanatum TaxID=34168 RepID=A0ACC2C031_DIPCM|nr:hypothetical protein O6H91_12G013400 [Diphasiastrum complanatum]
MAQANPCSADSSLNEPLMIPKCSKDAAGMDGRPSDLSPGLGGGQEPSDDEESNTKNLDATNSKNLKVNLLSEGRLQLDYTGDGSVDMYGQPAVKSRTGGWKACPYILGHILHQLFMAGTECCERLAFFGIGTNLVIYMIDVLHQDNASAAKNVALWSGTGYVTPIIGAFLADTYWGRYRTITSFSAIYLAGLFLLTLSTSLTFLRPPSCLKESPECEQASYLHLVVFYVPLYMVAFGMGGIKPCISSFGADQFDDGDRSESKKKAHFFNWFYMSINIGSLLSTGILVYIQENISWSLGYGIPAVMMVVAMSNFLLGKQLYRHQKPGGSPLTQIAQVLVAATLKCSTRIPSSDNQPCSQEEYAIQESCDIQQNSGSGFLDKAALELAKDKDPGYLPSAWRLCTQSQVQEVKSVVRLMPIWLTSIFFSTVYAQLSTLFVLQGSRMDRQLGEYLEVPPASLSIFEIISVIVMVPIYDRIVVKLARSFFGHQQGFTQLRRMGIGLFISIFTMIVASLVEVKRLAIAKKYGLLTDPNTPVPMSIFWQIPQYVLTGIAETFTYIGQLEFFYEQAPESMRTLGTALALATFGLGFYVNSILIVVVTDFTKTRDSPGWIPNNLNMGHLDYYFDLIAGVSAINFCCYVACACSFKYKHSKSSSSNE